MSSPMPMNAENLQKRVLKLLYGYRRVLKWRGGNPKPRDRFLRSNGSANRQRNDVTARPRKELRHRIEPSDPSLIHYACKTDPDLAVVVNAWQTLPEALKDGILAMVRAAKGG
jgi:hypothetical protein